MDDKLHKIPHANLDALHRIFTVPESSESTLSKIEQQISQNLMGFLKEHIVSTAVNPSSLERDFVSTTIDEDPVFVSDQAEFLLNKVVARSVHTSSPFFIGHMTSAVPYFMLPLAKIMMALNQNLVKIETSKAFTPLERQTIGMLHRLVYNKSQSYYDTMTQNHRFALGAFCSDGTLANITSLWVALNRLLQPQGDFGGVGQEGLPAALEFYNLSGLAILVSKRGHYSLSKAANVLGLGTKNLISVDTDENQKIDLEKLKAKVADLQARRVGIVAIIGVAGSTETGSVDPLEAMASICRDNNIHFHVDAAWGGPTLFSASYGYLLKGIEHADSVIVDAHKQLYVPVGAAVALFKSEASLNLVKHHAEYIIRKGSRDLGKTTLEGSRPGTAMLVHSALRIMGRKGLELLIDLGIEKAKTFARMIQEHDDFELITKPELNLLTYRFAPKALRDQLATSSATRREDLQSLFSRLTVRIQKDQRESGQTFVSRTALSIPKYGDIRLHVFRVVLANPLTTEDILRQVLEEQKTLGYSLLEQEPYLRPTV
ncbi:MAG: pyridoxal-dependent aspartate 1-decarboxylase PanP [Oligoflexales bacterium]